MSTPRPVYVKWIDSCNLFGDRWARSEELDQHEEETFCETLGWLVKQNEHSFFVAGSVAPEEIGSVMQIPRGAVRELREVNWIGKQVGHQDQPEEQRQVHCQGEGCGRECSGVCGAGAKAWLKSVPSDQEAS